MFNWLIFSSFVLSITMTVLGLLVDITYQMKTLPLIESLQSQQAQILPDYLADAKYFREHPHFSQYQPTKKDLAILISQIQDGDLQTPIIEDGSKQEFLELGKGWLDQKHKVPSLSNVQLLFDKIEEYDHWVLVPKPKSQWSSDLVVTAQIFLAWTFHFDPSSIRIALKKVRHLSHILINTENLNFKRAGLSLLEKEIEVLDHLKTQYRNSNLLWTPFSSHELKKYRRHLSQTSQYLNILTPPLIFKKIFLAEEKPVGLCAIYKDKHTLINWSEKYLTPRFPFEPSFKSEFQNIKTLAHYVRMNCQTLSEPAPPQNSWIQHTPFYRRIYGVKMIVNAENNRKYL